MLAAANETAADPETAAQILMFAVPAAFAVIGAGIGKVWERRVGHRSWLKDRQLEAYTEVLAASYDLWGFIAKEYDDPDVDQPTFDAHNRFVAAVQKVKVLGPDGVAAEAEVLDAAGTTMFTSVRSRSWYAAAHEAHGDDLTRTAEATAWVAAEDGFIGAARKHIR